jgi:hypothetical protein
MSHVHGRDGKPIRIDPEGLEPDDEVADSRQADNGGAEGPYRVGYKNPPQETRFGKGNKAGKGRPKGTRNLKTIVNQASSRKVAVKDGSKVRKMPKIEVTVDRLNNKAIAGDLKAIAMVIALQERYGPQEDPEGPSPEEIKLDLDSLRDFLRFQPDFDDPSGEADHG